MTDRVEVAAAVLLAVAAVATAWSSYQSTRWNGEQAKASGRTNAIRVEAARAQGLAQAQTQVDVATFTEWVNAYSRDETRLAQFYFRRFRSEFKPAVNAWIATRPLTNPDAPLTPFAVPQYQLAATAEATRLDAEAELSAATVRRDIQRASNYVLRSRPLRGIAVLRRDEHEAQKRTCESRPADPRLGHVRRNGDLDRHVPGEPLGLVERIGIVAYPGCRRGRVLAPRSAAPVTLPDSDVPMAGPREGRPWAGRLETLRQFRGTATSSTLSDQRAVSA